MAISVAFFPSLASSTVAAFSSDSSSRIFFVSLTFAYNSRISLVSCPMSALSVSRLASSSIIRPFSSSISPAARSLLCFASAVPLSHQPFWLASLPASCSKRWINSWMSCLTLANGSAVTRLASDVSKVLWRRSPWLRSMSATACCGPSDCTARCVDSKDGCCCRAAAGWPGAICNNAGGTPASASSAAASTASMALGSLATASATWTLAPCCMKRMVAADVLPLTQSLTVPTTDVSVASSFARTSERWSQVFALSVHICERSLRYSWSSRSVAATVDNSWLVMAIASCVMSFAFLRSSSARLVFLMKSAFSCMKAL
mmetsp:Transcript_71109/g.196346  ORF Transcript_71109/g.196346 Transcript_71109/m.196346 type:complete len:317 (+) Transcript_71109:669-1619(+)